MAMMSKPSAMGGAPLVRSEANRRPRPIRPEPEASFKRNGANSASPAQARASNVAAGAEVLVEQRIVAVDVGLRRRGELLAGRLSLHAALHASAEEPVQLLLDRPARLPGRQWNWPWVAAEVAIGASRERHTHGAENSELPPHPVRHEGLPPSSRGSWPRKHNRGTLYNHCWPRCDNEVAANHYPKVQRAATNARTRP